MVRKVEPVELVLDGALYLAELFLVAHVDAPGYTQVVLHFLELPKERKYFEIVLNHVFGEDGREGCHVLHFVL